MLQDQQLNDPNQSELSLPSCKARPEGEDAASDSTLCGLEQVSSSQFQSEWDELLPPKPLTVRDVMVHGIWFTCLPIIIPYKLTVMAANFVLYPAKTVFQRQFPGFREDVLSKKRAIKQKYQEVIRPVAGWLQTLIIRLILATIVMCCSLTLSLGAYCTFYYLVIPRTLQETEIPFKLQSPELKDLRDNQRGFYQQPALFGKVEVDNVLSNEYDRVKREPSGAYIYENKELKHVYGMSVPTEGNEIKMDNEFYELEIVFEIAETAHNYQRGNIYIQCQFNSYKSQQPSITVARQGYMDPKESLTRIVKELLQMVPFSSYFVHKNHQVAIQVFERFDNKDFGTSSIEFLLSNDTLQFKNARLRVKTSLEGVRWFMHDRFFVCMTVCVLFMTTSMCFSCLISVLALKKAGFLTFI